MQRTARRLPVDDPALVERCRSAALRLLRTNLTEDGILAATPSQKAALKDRYGVTAADGSTTPIAGTRGE